MPTMESKRASNFDDGGSQAKKPKTGKMSFAERMMAKMGHVEGQGLGKEGEGMRNPIAVKLRPQGAGVGAVKEKTPQQKAEERRAAEQRGEDYEDSSEEERKERRRRKEVTKQRSGQPGVKASARAPVRSKVRTVAQIEAEEGLQVPDVFKSFIDYTGAAPKQITSAADISTSSQDLVKSQQSTTEKLVKNARLELEAFASTWHELQDRKAYCDLQEQDFNRQLGEAKERASELLQIEEIAEQLSTLELAANDLDVQIRQMIVYLDQLKNAEKVEDFQGEITELVAASIDPLVAQSLNEWTPLANEPTILSHLRANRTSLLSADDTVPKIVENADSGLTSRSTSKDLDVYESLMFARWLPKVRTAVTHAWDPFEPQPLLQLLLDWKDVLPDFLLDIVVNQLAASKLIQALKSWTPQKNRSRRSPPHVWLFPWLQHLNSYHLDPRSTNGLLAEVKRKMRSMLTSCDLNKGSIEELDHWIGVDQLRAELQKEMQLKLLPRLSHFLRENLVIDPSNQDRTPIDVVLQWQKYFSSPKFARIFVDAFFPKWLDILYIWLTSDPNFDEIGQWYEWWLSVFPEDLREEPSINRSFDKGLEMMSRAVELGPELVKTELAEPSVDTTFAEQTNEAANGAPEHKVDRPSAEEPATTKDMLEELCEQDDLLLLPLRKAHPETGNPLMRITASASGAGGVVVYISGDIVMAQDKRDRGLWEPVDIYVEGVLPQLAEAR